MHRPTVGIIALILLLLALTTVFVGTDQATAGWRTGCLRVGILMGAFWLAMPGLKGVRPIWVLLCLGVGVVAMVFAAKHPFSMALLAVIALVLGYLSLASRARRPR